MQPKNIQWDKGHFYNVKNVTFCKDNIAIINIYEAKYTALTYIKYKLQEIKGERDQTH